MKAIAYLILEGRNFYSGRYHRAAIVGCRKARPGITKSQLAVKLELELPDDAFADVVPELRVRATIDDILSPGIKASILSLTDDGLASLERAIADEVAKREKELAANDG